MFYIYFIFKMNLERNFKISNYFKEKKISKLTDPKK